MIQPLLEARAEIYETLVFWSIRRQEKILLRLTDLYKGMNQTHFGVLCTIKKTGSLNYFKCFDLDTLCI